MTDPVPGMTELELARLDLAIAESNIRRRDEYIERLRAAVRRLEFTSRHHRRLIQILRRQIQAAGLTPHG